jgi:hypothetical protein
VNTFIESYGFTWSVEFGPKGIVTKGVDENDAVDWVGAMGLNSLLDLELLILLLLIEELIAVLFKLNGIPP